MNGAHLPWLERCRAFASEVIEPHCMEYDRINRFPARVHEAAYRWEIINQDFPVHLGGAGLPARLSAAGAERLAAACAPTAFTIGFNRGALHPVLFAGDTGQQERLVGGLLAEKGYASLCLTEPSLSGSNLMELETTAVKTGSGWIVNGVKSMVGNGGVASLHLVLARCIERGQPHGLCFFAVPSSDAVHVSPNTDKLGFRAVETPTLRFENAEIPAGNRIGEPGSGPEVVVETLAAIRAGGASVILGIVAGALQDALPWLGEREVYGGPLIRKSHIQLRLGELYGRLLAAREMVRRTAELREQGLPYSVEAGIAKLQASTLALEATSAVSQMFGWRGIDGSYPIQKRLRDARQTPVFEGTTEIQQLNLFRQLRATHLERGEV
jgi:alkylation response protein AidB-like acyl-CoA dehydrogenase